MSLMRRFRRIGSEVMSIGALSMNRMPRTIMKSPAKAIKTIGVAAMTFVLLTPAGVSAQEVGVSANAGWVSQYFYRGILQKTSSASAGLDVSMGPLSLGTWAADVGDGAEVDLYGSVGVEVEGLSLSAGGIAYLYTGQFDDTYREINLGAGYGLVSVELSIGQYDNFGAGKQDYWFAGASIEHMGFYGTVGGFGNDFSGSYGEAGYGFSAGDLDWTISAIINDGDLSGLTGANGKPTGGATLVLGVGKEFSF